MSKLPAMIVKLSEPEVDRWKTSTMYVTGMVSTNAIADGVNPLVSSYMHIYEADGVKKYSVQTRFVLDSSKITSDDARWFNWLEDTVVDNIREAIKLAESRARGCYKHALEFGLAHSLEGWIYDEE